MDENERLALNLVAARETVARDTKMVNDRPDDPVWRRELRLSRGRLRRLERQARGRAS